MDDWQEQAWRNRCLSILRDEEKTTIQKFGDGKLIK